MSRLNGAGVGRMISACLNGSDAARKAAGWYRPTPRPLFATTARTKPIWRRAGSRAKR